MDCQGIFDEKSSLSTRLGIALMKKMDWLTTVCVALTSSGVGSYSAVETCRRSWEWTLGQGWEKGNLCCEKYKGHVGWGLCRTTGDVDDGGVKNATNDYIIHHVVRLGESILPLPFPQAMVGTKIPFHSQKIVDTIYYQIYLNNWVVTYNTWWIK